MKLGQLHYFVAIAEEGSFTRAAERLIVAQPSLSQQIKLLETEIGGRLLERLPHGVRLTAAGEALLPEARAAIAHAERARQVAREALGLRAGRMEVATVTSIAYGTLPPILERWRAEHSEVSLGLHEFPHRGALANAVRQGVGDIAVGPRPVDWAGPVFHLGWEEFVVILPAADPLATRRSKISLEALKDRDWVLFTPDNGLSEVVRFACAQAGFTPSSAVHTSQVAAAPYLAAAGVGVALVPDNVVPPGLHGEVRRLTTPVIREVVAFGRVELSPAAAAFLEILTTSAWRPRPQGAVEV